MQTLFEQAPGIRTVRYDDQQEAEPLLKLFENIAQEQNWKPSNQLRAYPTSSVSFGLEVGGSLSGGLQLVRNNKNEGMPCLTVWRELNLLRSNTADIALLALRPDLRGKSGLFWLLCVEMWRYCRANHVDSLWVEVTPAKLRLYRRLGWPLQIAGPLRKHWDEPCYPCFMTLDAAKQEVASKAVKSTFYRQIVQISHR